MIFEIKVPHFISLLSLYLLKNETHCSKVGIYNKFLLYTIMITSQSSLMKDMWAEFKAEASFKSHVSKKEELKINSFVMLLIH